MSELPQNIRAIFFDFDGTLVCSIKVLVNILQECLREYGFEIERKFIRPLIGEPLNVIFQKLTGENSSIEFEKSFRQKEKLRHTSQYLKLLPGVLSFLHQAQKQNYQLGIVSTKDSGLIQDYLIELRIADFFAVVVGGDQVENPKPHPEPLFCASKKLNLMSNEVLFVGDSLLDLAAARAANVVFAGVLTGVASRADFLYAGAKPNEVFLDLSELQKIF